MQAEILERVCPGFIAVLADFFIYWVACRSPRPTEGTKLKQRLQTVRLNSIVR
jgi:hypothetical protein